VQSVECELITDGHGAAKLQAKLNTLNKLHGLHRAKGMCLHPKPRRGGLFIGQDANRSPSFCFSAARRGEHFHAQSVIGTDIIARIVVANAAPPKNKKNNLWVFVAINRPPLRGFKPFPEVAFAFIRGSFCIGAV
jgi:hypothetical protein